MKAQLGYWILPLADQGITLPGEFTLAIII